MRISDWSSDVCSSDLRRASTPVASAPRPSCADWWTRRCPPGGAKHVGTSARTTGAPAPDRPEVAMRQIPLLPALFLGLSLPVLLSACAACRSEENTSELQSLMRISYAVFCLKKKQQHLKTTTQNTTLQCTTQHMPSLHTNNK